MSLLPKFKKCPCCKALIIFKVNGVKYDNAFQSLSSWTLKKKVSCKKCNVELGLFINNLDDKEEKLLWIDLFKIEDFYYNELSKLQKNKIDFKKNDKKYHSTLKEITSIQNKIRLEQAKVKIKLKIENRLVLI